MSLHLKHRMAAPLLATLLALCLPLFCIGQVEEQEEEGRADAARRALVEKLAVPEDRNAVAGSFRLGGETVEVSAGEHYDMLVVMNLMGGTARRAISPEDAWSRIMLLAWADAIGIEISADALNEKLRRDQPTIYEGLVRRWESMGMTAEAGEAYTLGNERIARLKNFVFDSQRTTTKDAFDQFKIRKLLYKFEYACFQNTDFVAELAEKGAAREELDRFYKSDRAVAAKFRRPATVSGAIVSFDPADFTEDMVKKFGDSSKVTRERAIAYFKANQKRLMGSIPASKRHLMTLTDETRLEDVVSPFSLVKDQITKKLTLEHLITDAHKEATTAGADADLAAIAEKYHLKYRKIDNLDRRGAMAEMAEFGIPAFTQLFGASPGQVSRSVAVVGEKRFFFVVTEKKDAHMPELDEVIDDVRKFYFDAKSSELARERAREVFDEMQAKVEVQLEPERKRLEQEALASAEREIKQMNITSEADKRRAKARARARTRLPLDKKKKELLPGIFDEIVKRRNLKLIATPYFEFSAAREDRSGIEDDNESRLVFLQSSYQVRSLPKGGVTSMVLEDHVTHSFILGRLIDKKDPSLETMGAVDLLQARGQVTQIKQARFPRQFQFLELKKKFNFQAAK